MLQNYYCQFGKLRLCTWRFNKLSVMIASYAHGWGSRPAVISNA